MNNDNNDNDKKSAASSSSSSSSSSGANSNNVNKRQQKKKPSSYSYEERVLLSSKMPFSSESTSASTTIRLEFVAEWDTKQSKVHPFTQIQQKLFPLPTKSNSNNDDDDDFLNLWIQISSTSISKYPRNNLHQVPILLLLGDGENEEQQHNNNWKKIRGPSGFWLQLQHSCLNDDDNNNNIHNNEWIEQLIQQRLITTPISKHIKENGWDYIMKSCDNDDDTTTNMTEQQLILPTNGQGWSVDALQQTLSSMNSILSSSSSTTTFLGHRSVMDWSNLLVASNTYDKTMYWNLQRSSSSYYKFQFGLEYTIISTTKETIKNEQDFIKSLLIESNKRPLLGPRYVYQVLLPNTHSSPTSTTTTNDDQQPYYELQPITSPNDLVTVKEETEQQQGGDSVVVVPWITVEQVLRQPTLHYGRLETWIETRNNNNNCDTILYRQVLPPIFTPSWRTLQVSSSSSLSTTEEEEEANNNKNVVVQWLDDGTSILEVQYYHNPKTTTTTTTTTVISVDVSAAYLTIDDFPGDPNRGRELPPALVRCINNNNNIGGEGDGDVVDVYTSSLLVLPPVPDMSMPFNVLSLTCSLYAYLIGSLLIVLIKKGSENIVYKLHPEKKPKKLRDKIKDKISQLKARIKGGSGGRRIKNVVDDDNNNKETDDDDDDDDDQTNANVDDTTKEKSNNNNNNDEDGKSKSVAEEGGEEEETK